MLLAVRMRGWRSVHPPASAVEASRALLTRMLNHHLPLRGRCVSPALAQYLPSFGGQLLEPPEILANRRLLVRRERLKLLPSITQRVALLRGQGMPLLKALLGLSPLFRCHAQPTVTSPRQCLLPLRWQGIPIATELSEQLLLLCRQARPRHALRALTGGLRWGLLRKRGRRCRQQQHQHAAGSNHFSYLRTQEAAHPSRSGSAQGCLDRRSLRPCRCRSAPGTQSNFHRPQLPVNPPQNPRYPETPVDRRPLLDLVAFDPRRRRCYIGAQALIAP